jgi:glycerol-3-phosphate dehydrogenase
VQDCGSSTRLKRLPGEDAEEGQDDLIVNCSEPRSRNTMSTKVGAGLTHRAHQQPAKVEGVVKVLLRWIGHEVDEAR